MVKQRSGDLSGSGRRGDLGMGEYNVYLEIKVTSPDTEKNLNDRFEFKVGDVICINDEKKSS